MFHSTLEAVSLVGSAMQDWLLLLFGANQSIDRTALWTGILTVIALFGSFFAWLQLRSLGKTSSADFAKQFSDSFFTPQSRTLFSLLLNSALEFRKMPIMEGDSKIYELPYFRIRADVATQVAGIIKFDHKKVGFSAFEVDDLLLGSLDDLGWFVKRRLIDFRMADQMLGWYVTKLYTNTAIKSYLDHDPAAFPDFRYLACRCKEANA